MKALTQRQIEENKQKVIELLKMTKREGMDALILYLEKHDYFTAPASTAYHMSCRGGLAAHSLNVYYNMMRLYYGDNWRTLDEYPMCKDEVEHENIIIVALLHDLCKVDFYKLYNKNTKEGGAWHEVQAYRVEEKMPILGHGTKSVIVAQQFIELYFQEIQAIAFHMGMQDKEAEYINQVTGVLSTVQLALYVHLADLKAGFEDDYLALEEAQQEEDDGLPF